MNTDNFDITVKIQKEIAKNWRDEQMEKEINKKLDKTLKQLTWDAQDLDFTDQSYMRVTAKANPTKYNNYGYNTEITK